MSHHEETYQTWNKVAQLYQEKFMGLVLYNDSYALFADAIQKPTPVILEVGCGPGNITKHLLSLRDDFKILGIDFAPHMIELARKNNPAAQFEVMDARDILKLNNTYDGIIAGFCLPYLSKEESLQLIRDAFSLLHQNGMLYISFVEGDPTLSGFHTASTGDRTYFYYHELDVLKNEIMSCGFDIPVILKVNFEGTKSEIHTILLAKKP